MSWQPFSGGATGAMEEAKAQLEASIRKGKKKEGGKDLKQEPAKEVKETEAHPEKKENNTPSGEKKEG